MHTFYNSKERWRTEEGSPFRLSDGRLVDSEEEELALIYESEEHVYFARPNADETGGTAMFLKRNGDELELSSDNFFAYDSLIGELDAAASGTSAPVYASVDARYAIAETRRWLESPPSPTSNAALAKIAASRSRTDSAPLSVRAERKM